MLGIENKAKKKTKAELLRIAKYEDSRTVYSTVKTSLHSIIKYSPNIDVLFKSVKQVNHIVINTTQLVMLFILYQFNKDLVCPDISYNLMDAIMKILCTAAHAGSAPIGETLELINMIRPFYEEHFKPIKADADAILPNIYLYNALNYEKTAIVTNYSNHIKNNYEKFFNRYINVISDKKNTEDLVTLKLNQYKAYKKMTFYVDYKKKVKMLIQELDKTLQQKLKNYGESLLIFNYDTETKSNLINKFNEELIDVYITSNTKIEKDCLKQYNKDKIVYYKQLNKETSDFQKSEIKKIRTEITQLKNDLLKRTDKCIKNEKYDLIKKHVRMFILPNLNNIIFKKTTPDAHLLTYVNFKPLYFFNSLLKMSSEIEKLNQKSFSCFPLRSSIIPKYVKFDTLTIGKLFLPPVFNNIKKEVYLHDIVKYRDDIWEYAFKTDKKVFNMHYNSCRKEKDLKKIHIFSYQICTDGVGCSILKLRKDKFDIDKDTSEYSVPKPYGYISTEDRYLTDFTQEELNQNKNKEIVGIDPGISDLLYSSKIVVFENKNGEGYEDEEIIRHRFSQNQRRKELKTKRYRDIRNERMQKVQYYDNTDNPKLAFTEFYNNRFKNQPDVYKYHNNDHEIDPNEYIPQEIESKLSNYNFKTCSFKKAKEAFKVKNEVNDTLYKFYEEDIYRFLRWYSYINKQRSDANMINKFKEKMGKPEDTLICFGNWGQRQGMKHNETVKGKSYRTLYKNAGYTVCIIDEYNTSAKSYPLGEPTEKFRMRGNPKLKMTKNKKKALELEKKYKYKYKNKDKKTYVKDTYKLWHGLLRFKTDPYNKQARENLRNELGMRFNRRKCKYSYIKGEIKANPKVEHVLINRDLNGSLNIRYKAICYLNNQPLPDHFRRI